MQISQDLLTNEILAHLPLCVYPYAKEILLCGAPSNGLGDGLLAQLNKHGVNVSSELDKEKFYDVSIAPAYKKELIVQSYRALKDDGILVMQTAAWDTQEFKEQLKSFEIFRFAIAFSYHASAPLTGVFASKKYHPTADLKLHIADMLEGNAFYNADIHKCLFAMPGYIYQDLKALLKL